jgi:hypothetical protein
MTDLLQVTQTNYHNKLYENCDIATSSGNLTHKPLMVTWNYISPNQRSKLEKSNFRNTDLFLHALKL